MSEKLTKLEWESIAYIVRIVEDRDDISLNQFELIFRALAESLTMQATIDELTRMANEAPGCRCGCRSIDQTDQIAELYRQISTVEAELNERKGQAMVWESDQLIIAKLQEQIEKLAAENLELNHIRAISEGNNYYMEHIGILERRAKQAEDNHEICAGALLAESQRIETMRIENLGAKGTLEYIASGPWPTVDEYVLSVKECLKIAIAEKEQLVKFTAALEKGRDKAQQMVRDWNHEHAKTRSRISELEAAVADLKGIAEDLRAQRGHAEQRWFDVSKELDELTETSAATIARDRAEIRKELEAKIKQLEATLTREREENARTLNAGPAQANQPPPTKIPSECMHDWQPAFNLERAEFVPGVLRCPSCGSTRKADQPRPKSLRTPKEEYNQIAVDMAQRAMDDLIGAQLNCCDDVRIHHGHCESCGAQAGPASKGNLMRQVKDLVQRNNQQAKYIKELGGVLPLFGAHREASSPVKAHLHDWRNQYSDLMGDLRVAWQQCAGCGERRDVGKEVEASFEATPELVSDQRAKDFECECPYHSCALATVFYGHCQICGGEWIPF